MRVSTILLFICFFFASLYSYSIAAMQGVLTHNIERILIKKGDDLLWRNVNFDDKNWQYADIGLPSELTQFWLRIHLTINDDTLLEQQAIFSSILASYEVYWDGELIANSGKVGKSAALEISGDFQKTSLIKQKLWTKGKHVISLRLSNFHSPQRLRSGFLNVFIGSAHSFGQYKHSLSLVPLMVFGALLIIAAYFLQLYLIYAKDNVHLLFSLLCFSVCCLLITEIWKNVFGYRYDWHYFRLYLVGVFTFIIAVLLPMFFLYKFNLKHKLRWFALMVLLLISVSIFQSGFDAISMTMFMLSFIFSLLITLRAIPLKKQGAIVSTIAVALFLISNLGLAESFQD